MPKNKFLSSMLSCFLLLIIVICISGCVTSGQLVKIEPTQGVTQGFIFMAPEKPVASVILFAGGHGSLKLTGGSSMRWGSSIFTVRSRGLFAAKGFQVAVVDAPFDKFGYMSINRGTKEHRSNIRAVTKYLRTKADVPVWLVGTSRGTDSVANIAIHDPEPYGGAVFTSSVQDVAFQDVSRISLPSLVIHHRKDQCYASSPLTAEMLYKKLTQAPVREIRWFTGGYTKFNVCGPNAYHGFLGIEQKVVNAIAEFIQSNSRNGNAR